MTASYLLCWDGYPEVISREIICNTATLSLAEFSTIQLELRLDIESRWMVDYDMVIFLLPWSVNGGWWNLILLQPDLVIFDHTMALSQGSPLHAYRQWLKLAGLLTAAAWLCGSVGLQNIHPRSNNRVNGPHVTSQYDFPLPLQASALLVVLPIWATDQALQRLPTITDLVCYQPLIQVQFQL